MSQTIGVIIALFHSVLYYINENFSGWVRGREIAVPFRLYPSTIPNHFFIISTLIQSLKKIGQKLLKLESGNELLMSIKGHNS